MVSLSGIPVFLFLLVFFLSEFTWRAYPLSLLSERGESQSCRVRLAAEEKGFLIRAHQRRLCYEVGANRWINTEVPELKISATRR